MVPWWHLLREECVAHCAEQMNGATSDYNRLGHPGGHSWDYSPSVLYYKKRMHSLGVFFYLSFNCVLRSFHPNSNRKCPDHDMGSLTHWGRVMHICIGKLTNIDSGNGLSPERRQAIIWTNAGMLWIRTLETNFSEILSGMHTFSFKKMHLKISFARWRPLCPGLNVLT